MHTTVAERARNGALHATTEHLDAPAERELARWDGDQLTIRTAEYLDMPALPALPVLTSISVGQGVAALEWATHYQPMVTPPTVTNLLELVATAAQAWDRRRRILLIVRIRTMSAAEVAVTWP